MRAPRIGEPARVAFVGRGSDHGHSALSQPAGGLLPRFFEFRAEGGSDAGELGAALADWGAGVVVVFDPATLPAGTLGDLDAVTLGFAAGAELPSAAAADFDRLVTTDPRAAEPTGEGHTAIWRSLPLPVSDGLYAPVRPGVSPPRALFVGASTLDRERFLIDAKHNYDVLHYAHGLHGAELEEVLARSDVAISLRPTPDPGFDDGVLRHLAAGLLVVSEPLTPTHGLEPGIDFVEIRRPDELMTILHQLTRRPDTFERVRLRGREKAESHRASRVWPRLIGDLFADVAAFGRVRDQRSSASRGAALRNTP